MRRGGFTLIELLVVIAVVAVMAALLFPVFAKARARARASVCISNLRQIGSAMDLYLGANDDRFPDARADARTAGQPQDGLLLSYLHERFCRGLTLEPGQVSFIHALGPYLGSRDVAICPSDAAWKRERPVTSYEYKVWLAQGRTLARVPQPSRMAMVWEQWAYHHGDGHGSEHSRDSAMNILFVDGHVRYRALSEATTARYGNGPNLDLFFSPAPPHAALRGADFE